MRNKFDRSNIRRRNALSYLLALVIGACLLALFLAGCSNNNSFADVKHNKYYFNPYQTLSPKDIALMQKLRNPKSMTPADNNALTTMPAGERNLILYRLMNPGSRGNGQIAAYQPPAGPSTTDASAKN